MNLRKLLKGLLARKRAGLFRAGYEFFVEPSLRLRVQKWHVQREDWPIPPLRIAVVSDLHAGEPFVGMKRIERIVRRTNAIAPDLVLLLGDFARGHKFETRPVKIDDIAPVLAQLEAPHGVYAVLGNHDWWADRAAQRRKSGPNIYGEALERNGIPVLSNSALKLQSAGIWLAGLEDQRAILRGLRRCHGLDDLPATLAQITDDAPVVMMAHEPDAFPEMPKQVALTLSGHTHGGQIRVFGWAPFVPSRFGNKYAYGHVREDGRDLVVSGGIGCSILPVRLGVVPEITVIELSA
ncbi:metallophosphoesterase [Ruegeria discodermiae]|uniref:metallophosphoesterase n=1 Tax=Ruegeria discodermiae TaxID=3064389 RepID=UPI0027420A3F|nr:metallophosphoesterase [Ruegeria sp. 2205SS24-7]